MTGASPFGGGPVPGQAPRGAEAALNRLVRHGTANLLGAAASALSQFAVVLAVVRLYGADDAGRLFATTAAFFIVLALVQLGADQGVMRFVAWHRARGDEQLARQVLWWSGVPVIVISVVGMASMLVLAAPLADLVSQGSGSDVVAMLRVLALVLPFAAAYELVLAATRGFGTMRPTVLLERLLRPALQPVAIVVVGVAGLGTTALAWAWAAPYLVALCGAAYALHRVVTGPADRSSAPPAVQDLRPLPPSRSVGAEFWAFTGPRAAAKIFQVALQRVDIIVVAALLGPAPAAVYTAASRLIALGLLANQALQQVISPQFAAMLARDELAGTELLLRRATQWLTAMAWPGYLALMVLAPWFMGIFGAGFAVGASSVVVLAVAMVLATAAGPVDVLLLMAGRSTVSLINMIVALAVDVIGCLLLVPRIGILGAAIAWAAAIVVRNGLAIAQARRLLAMTAGSRELLELSLAALGCCALVPVPLAIAGADPVLIGLSLAVGVGGYLALLWRGRARLGLDDIAAMLRSTTLVGAATPRP